MLIVELLNISNLADVSDYQYVVRVNYTVLAEGTVIGHRRADGWAALVARVVDQETNANVLQDGLTLLARPAIPDAGRIDE